MKKLFLLFFLVGFTTAFSQTKKTENSIDLAESKCLNQDAISNAEMCNCTIEARELWNKELNKYYIY